MSKKELMSHLGVIPEVWEKGIQESVVEYAPGGSSGVSSVNGKLGAVELIASDIGALPDSTQIPIVDVNKAYVDNQDALKVNITDAFTKSQADSYYQAKGDYVILGDVYSKDQSDARYRLKSESIDLSGQPISNITGLQTALDSKASQSTTYNKTEVDSALSGKANTIHNHAISDITNLQSSLDSKANQSTTYTKTEVDSALTLKADKTYVDTQDNLRLLIASANSIYARYSVKMNKTGLSTSITGGASAVNLTGLMTSPTITSFANSIMGTTLTAPTLTTAGSGGTAGFKIPALAGLDGYSILISISFTGSVSGLALGNQEYLVSLRRTSDSSLVRNFRMNIASGGTGSIVNEVFTIPTYISGVSDPFVSGGFYLELKNNSIGTSSVSITALELIIQC